MGAPFGSGRAQGHARLTDGNQVSCRNRVEFSLGLTNLLTETENHLMGLTMHRYLIFETAIGFCGIAWNDLGIRRFQLPTRNAAAAERILLRRVRGAETGATTPEVAEAVAAVKRYFEGERTDFSRLTLDLDDQDALFQRIYAAARQVGWGRTTTYGALAKQLGLGPEAARDVGQAMAKNPVALIIPCHRVLAAGGKLGGFSAPGGVSTKIRMLALEGVHVEPERPAQWSLGL
jgi:methylated-DNA-[protein]-cysteine S-methyltransferase